jgi:hypothetical protein
VMVDGKKDEAVQQPKRAALIDNDRELRRVDKVRIWRVGWIHDRSLILARS